MMRRFCDLCETEIVNEEKRGGEYVAIGLTFYLHGEYREFVAEVHVGCTPESLRELVALKGKSSIKDSDPRAETEACNTERGGPGYGSPELPPTHGTPTPMLR